MTANTSMTMAESAAMYIDLFKKPPLYSLRLLRILTRSAKAIGFQAPPRGQEQVDRIMGLKDAKVPQFCEQVFQKGWFMAHFPLSFGTHAPSRIFIRYHYMLWLSSA
jgi:hypothetical protein